MPEIRIMINPIFLNHLKEVVETVSRSLWRRPAISMQLVDETDEDLREAWQSGLLLSMREDLEALSGMFVDIAGGSGHLEVKEEDAEKILRAASALRLRLRETCLQDISEEDLETGKLDFHSLSLEDQRVYGIYLFLANLQEQLVDSLDPSANSWEE
ncbi:MAG: hypothetical protein ACQKBW_13635 [Puniceicoccales bacterium]